MTKTTLSILVTIALSGSTLYANEALEVKTQATTQQVKTITVTEQNYAHAETARNYRNWLKAGANNKLVHMKNLPPRGKSAPTVQMNDDTLYSIVVAETVDGKINFMIPKSDVYMAVQVVTEGGHGQHYVVESGEYSLPVETKFAMLIYRTGMEKGIEVAKEEQKKIKSDMMKFGTYKLPNYDFNEVEEWTAKLTAQTAGGVFVYTFPRESKLITDRHQWNLENANGWGGASPELHVGNKYTNSPMLKGDKCLTTTFKNPKSKFFTSFTAYDASRYLMEGVNHVSSNTWKTNADGTVTVSFNCGKDAINNIDTKGKDFTYTVRYYGVSQDVLDGKITPSQTTK